MVAITKIALRIFGNICLIMINMLDKPIIFDADTYSLFFSTKVDDLVTLANCGHSEIPIANINTYIAHSGVGIIIIGITFTSIFKQEENYLLSIGEQEKISNVCF